MRIGMIVVCFLASVATANAAALTPELASSNFLPGTWQSDKGVVADTGGTSQGTSDFTVEGRRQRALAARPHGAFR